MPFTLNAPKDKVCMCIKAHCDNLVIVKCFTIPGSTSVSQDLVFGLKYPEEHLSVAMVLFFLHVT